MEKPNKFKIVPERSKTIALCVRISKKDVEKANELNIDVYELFRMQLKIAIERIESMKGANDGKAR